jgi:TonB family protein
MTAVSRRDPTILFALLVALGAHLALLGVGVRAARRDLGWWLKAPAQAPPPAVVTPVPSDPMQQLGDHNTNGASINNSPGERPLESMYADARQEQAAMQQDPAGFGGRGSNQPVQQTQRGDQGDNSVRATNTGAQSSAAVFGSRESSLADSSPKVVAQAPTKTKTNSQTTGTGSDVDPLSSGPQSVANLPKSISPAQPPTVQNNQSSDSQSQAQQNGASSTSGGGAGGRAGAPEAGAGIPLPSSDFESFPVTKIASRFVAGEVVARTGRKHKIRDLSRELGLAGFADLQTMENAYLVLLLTIDPSGNVIDVKIKHSSGSDNVDLPCQRAAYSWWFEPLKDPKTGEARVEQMEFTIYF